MSGTVRKDMDTIIIALSRKGVTLTGFNVLK